MSMASLKDLPKSLSFPFFHLSPFITSSSLFLLLLLVFFFLLINGRNPQQLASLLLFNPTSSSSPSESHTSSTANTSTNNQFMEYEVFGSIKKRGAEECDLFDGRWVYDEPSPSYPPGSCPFIDSGFDCFRNGRRDLNYTKLRWRPKHCTIPRLEGKKMLEMLRGKRMVFVGDSLNRNMWESLICMLRHSLQDKDRVFEVSGKQNFKAESSYSFRFIDYNCSIEFFRSPFLVQPSEKVGSKGKVKESLRLDMIDSTSTRYKDADVIIFNSGHWWTHEKTSKGINYYQEGDYVHPQLSSGNAYRKAMATWAKWVDEHIDPLRTRVFFRGYAWSHFSGGQWNSGGNCDGETLPITDDKHLAKKYLVFISILESVLAEMRTPVLYLNITRMTDYRKDGHPSVYRVPAGRRSPETFQDCSHWCLPGVPDAWNELLYAMLLQGLR